MARSKVTTPSGKKVTPKKKRDTKARASVKITQRKDGDFDVTKRNDNDPTVTYTGRDKRKTVRGPDKVTKVKVPAKTTTTKGTKRGKETERSKFIQNQHSALRLSSRRPEKRYERVPTTTTTTKPAHTKTTRTPTTKKNKDYNKKKPPTKTFSKEAKNPGGHILGIPKTEKMNRKDTKEYRHYLRNN